MSGYIISKASVTDAAGISAIEKECFTIPLTAEQILSQIENESFFVLCAKNAGAEILGYAAMYTVLDEGYITDVAVSSSARRKHLADALLETLLDISSGLDLAFVTLEVRESNDPAKALYKKHGFAVAGLRKNYYQKPTENAVIMTKVLSEE